MTTLIAWVSYKNKKPSALNIASDSRFTWGSEDVHWDRGRKIFWCKRGAEIFGYAGDVVTQSNFLSQLCDLIDYSGIFRTMDSGKRHAAFVQLVQDAVDAQVEVPKQGMIFFHGTRADGAEEGGGFPFRIWQVHYDKGTGRWNDKEHIFPKELETSETDKTIYPKIALAAGSGAAIFRMHRDRNLRDHGCNARSVFHALTQAIGSSGDPCSGGPAQAVTLGLKGKPKPIGFSMAGSCSLAGMTFGNTGAGNEIDWRNEDFEYIRPSDLKRRSGAPKHWFW